jgi:hypothetical protein
MDGDGDTLWIIELETVLGLPIHYTDAGNMSLTKRGHLLCEAWSVHVVKHILQSLKPYFECESNVSKKTEKILHKQVVCLLQM